jgi:hypothetical protein
MLFSCTVMAPYEWVWIVGPYLFSCNLCPFPWRVGRKSADSILLSSLVLNPRRSSKMWIEPFACLVFIVLLIPFLRSLSVSMASGSKEGESHVPLFWFFRA